MSEYQPQHPYQPYGVPPAPPTPPRRRHRIRTAFLTAVGVIALASVISAITGNDGSNPVADATTTATVVAPAPPAEVTAPDIAIPDPTVEETTEEPPPPPPAAPKVLLDQSGSGIKVTTGFTVTGPWEVRYTFDCATFGNQGNFIVTVADSAGDLVAIPVNALAASGKDTSAVYDTGVLHLEINSECDWHVTVVG